MVVHGLSSCGVWASVVATLGLSCPEACGILVPHQGLNPLPWIARWILNHWTIREFSTVSTSCLPVCFSPDALRCTVITGNFPNHAAPVCLSCALRGLCSVSSSRLDLGRWSFWHLNIPSCRGWEDTESCLLVHKCFHLEHKHATLARTGQSKLPGCTCVHVVTKYCPQCGWKHREYLQAVIKPAHCLPLWVWDRQAEGDHASSFKACDRFGCWLTTHLHTLLLCLHFDKPGKWNAWLLRFSAPRGG